MHVFRASRVVWIGVVGAVLLEELASAGAHYQLLTKARIGVLWNLEAAAVMAVLWSVAIFAGTLALLHAVDSDVALHQVLLEVSSALGNVGISSGITAPDLHWAGKLVLMLLMWMGRLEIVPLLVLVAALTVARRTRRSAKERR